MGQGLMTRVAVSASQSRGVVLPRPGAREESGIRMTDFFPTERGGVLITKPPPSITLALTHRTLENSEFDAQEFLRVLAEIRDQQTHVSCETRHVVVESWIGEKFSERPLAGVQLAGSVADIGGSVA